MSKSDKKFYTYYFMRTSRMRDLLSLSSLKLIVGYDIQYFFLQKDIQY